MPRTIEEILAHADELTRRFEEYEPRSDHEIQIDAAQAIANAASARSQAEKLVLEAVRQGRAEHMSWNSIGHLLGTSGEAARQRYKELVA